MPKRVTAPDYCMIARAMEVLGEQWTLLIIRDAFFGIKHFDEFQRSLGIARNILATRLTKLVEEDILSREPNPDDRRKVEYRLTERGRDLLPIIVALTQWGTRWLARPGELRPFSLVDRETGAAIDRIEVRSTDGRVLGARDFQIVAGPGLTDDIRRSVPALRNVG